MTLETYLAYLATCAIFFASPPGPSQLLMIANSARYGFRPSIPTAAGDLSANTLQMLAAGFGLTALIAANPNTLTVIKWLGVAYLVWRGVKTYRSHPKDTTASGEPVFESLPPSHFYFQGFFTSASNPKAIFFFAALFPQFIDPAHALAPQIAILAVTYLAIDGTMLMVFGATSQRLFSGFSQTAVARISGALMIAAAIALGLREPGVR